MKKISMAVGAAIALAGVTAPAQAQNLTWFGSTACFNTPVSSPSNRVSISSCNISSSTSTYMEWDSNNGSYDRSSIDFQINGYDNTGTSNDWPGGPASSSTNRTLAFGSIGATQKLYLGYFGFNRDQGDDLLSAYLSMRLTFAGGTVNLADKLQITGVEQSGGDGIRVAAVGSPVAFSMGGYDYEFRYTGFDDYTNNNPGDDQYYCQNTNDNALPTTFTNDASRKLCGELKYVGGGVPNIQTVPEPSTYALMGAGLLGIFGFARRRNRNA